MSVIIRLQNLPLSANAADIRSFFAGLRIPSGSVHIVGGEDGDAFIGFATDEDARQAMALDHGRIHDQKVQKSFIFTILNFGNKWVASSDDDRE